MKTVSYLGFFLILILVFSSCVPGPNDAEKTPNREGKIVGFWYNFGFVIGAGLFLSGGILGRKRRKKRI